MGDGGPSKGYFHPEDVAIVMSQKRLNADGSIDEAEVAVVVNAVVSNRDCKVLLAASGKGSNGYESLFDDPDHLVALLCPPYTEEGGIFRPDPQPAQ